MSFTAIIGGNGDGKTSWMNLQVKRILRAEGRRRLQLSRAKVEELNRTRKTLLTPPDKVPIYMNLDAKFKIGYKKFYKPYYIDEEYFGLPNKGKLVIPVAPYSVVALQEMDEEYNSREHNISKSVSGIYHEYRHFHLDIFLDLHKLMLLDSIVRNVISRTVEMRGVEIERNFAGGISNVKWHYRQFDDIKEAQRYVLSDGKDGVYRELVDEDEGNIFDCFNTHSREVDFIPKEGEDFIYLPQPSEVDISELPPETAKFYSKGAK